MFSQFDPLKIDNTLVALIFHTQKKKHSRDRPVIQHNNRCGLVYKEIKQFSVLLNQWAIKKYYLPWPHEEDY